MENNEKDQFKQLGCIISMTPPGPRVGPPPLEGSESRPPVKRDRLLEPCHQKSQSHAACSPQAQGADPQELQRVARGGSVSLGPALWDGEGGRQQRRHSLI